MRTALVFIWGAVALLVGGCGDDAITGRPAVVATTGVAADIVRNVTGADADVIQLVPDGASPHSYAPSAQEQADLNDADLLVYFHPGLEAALPIDQARRSFEIAAHGAAGEDPHVWLDPALISAALPALAAELGSIDPESAAGYERRAAAYATQLEALDRELEALVAEVPREDRKLIASHDLLGYFAERYDFEVTGAVFGITPEAEASSSSIAGLIETVERSGVPAVFAQEGDDPEVLEQIAEEAEVEVVDDLLLETLGPGAGSYIEMMRISTERIVDALGG